MNSIKFKLTGLTCEACVKLAANRFRKVPGVSEVSIDLATGSAEVKSEADLDLASLESSLAGTNYLINKS